MLAAFAGVKPGEQLKCALRVGIGSSCDDQKMEALPGDSQKPRQFRFFPIAMEVSGDCAGQLIPERGIDAGPRSASARNPTVLAISPPRGPGGGLCHRHQRLSDRFKFSQG